MAQKWYVVEEIDGAVTDPKGNRATTIEDMLDDLGGNWVADPIGAVLSARPRQVLGKRGHTQGVKLIYPQQYVVRDTRKVALHSTTDGPVPAGAIPVGTNGYFIAAR